MSIGTVSRPASASRSSHPFSHHVRADEVAKPWRRTTGGVGLMVGISVMSGSEARLCRAALTGTGQVWKKTARAPSPRRPSWRDGRMSTWCRPLRRSTDLLRIRRARIFRRLFMAAAVRLPRRSACAGQLGVLSRTTTAQGGGYELTVTYGQVSRGGLATPWSFEVHRPGGFDGPITVSTTSSYLDLFDENGFDPEPSTSTATPETR